MMKVLRDRFALFLPDGTIPSMRIASPVQLLVSVSRYFHSYGKKTMSSIESLEKSRSFSTLKIYQNAIKRFPLFLVNLNPRNFSLYQRQ